MRARQAWQLTIMALSGSLLLASCGGGGGGGGSSSGGAAAAPAGGVAAKGLLKRAVVTAYCGPDEKTVLGKPAVTSDIAGHIGEYTIDFGGTSCDKPVKLVVTANSDDSTLMVNENGGADIKVGKDSGFKLRRYLDSKPASTISNVHITPYTDAAAQLLDDYYAAHQKAPSKDMVTVAEQAVADTLLAGRRELLYARPKDAAEPKTDDEQALFNQLKTLMPAAGAGSIDDVKKNVSDQVLTTVRATVTDLADGGYKKGETTVSVQVNLSNSILAAKSLFASLKSDMLALWNDTGSGFLNTKAAQMDADFKTVHSTGENVLMYVYNMLNGAEFVAQYQADAASGIQPVTMAANHGWYTGADQNGEYLLRPHFDFFGMYHTACKIYTSGKNASAPTTARCFWSDWRSYAYDPNTGNTVYTDRLVKVAATSVAKQYTWETFPRDCSVSNTPVGTQPSTTTCTQQAGSAVLTGAVTDNVGSGSAKVAIKGQVLPMVADAAATDLDISVDGSITDTATSRSGNISLTGSVKSGAVTVSFLSGTGLSVTGTPTSESGNFTFALRADTGKFRYEGSIDGNGQATRDATTGSTTSGTAELSFAGTLAELANGSATPFFEGKIADKRSMSRGATGWAKTADIRNLTGKITTSSGAYSLNASSTLQADGTKKLAMTYSNPAGRTINMTGTSGTASDTVEFTSGTIRVVVPNEGDSAVFDGTTQVGTMTKNRRVNFVDASYILFM